MTTEVRLVANPKAPRVAVTSANDHRKSYATWTLVGAGALLAGGAVFGGLAYKTWGDARDVCGGVACATMDELDRGTALSNRATDYAHAADALVIVGVAAAVVGVTLWVTSPPERGVAIAARANRDGAGLLLVGRW